MDKPYVLIIHEVEDYGAWKVIFDNAAQIRKNAGEESYKVLKYEEDRNKGSLIKTLRIFFSNLVQ